MAYDPVVARYAEAFFSAAKEADQVVDTQEHLQLLYELIKEEPRLKDLLRHPGIEADAKVTVLDKVTAGKMSALVKAFLTVVASLGRAELLQQMVEAFNDYVDADQGRMKALVRSARVIDAAMLQRLRKALEASEQKQIELHTEVSPDLLGGLQVMLGHRVIDGSVKRQIEELRERLSTVRVI